ncbi:unnamed protein product [Effrenium voratum]|nr:unnamed protein product [Effrenium voratum]
MDRLQRILRQVNVGLHAQPCAGLDAREDRRAKAAAVVMQYIEGVHRLRTSGETPPMTLYELIMHFPERSGGVSGGFSGRLEKRFDKAEASGSLRPLELLPGPWHDAKTREDKLRLLAADTVAQEAGMQLQLYAAYQLRYGDKGLSSNIAVPCVVMHSRTSEKAKEEPQFTDSFNVIKVVCRVMVSDPEDAERIARIHVRKEPNFGPGLMDSVISTTDNEHWRDQRQHLMEAFLPLSTLAQIMPVSLARAKDCSERLAQQARDGPVDMSDFLLHEAQAQLQLALLGVPEETMDRTNAGIRATFAGSPDAKLGHLSGAMKDIMQHAREATNLGLPTDGCPVRGPLSRALQTGQFHSSTDYGTNLLIILFAGHDTTGHTMTWLLYELARHPDIQRKVQEEVDAFFASLQKDPTYKDGQADSFEGGAFGTPSVPPRFEIFEPSFAMSRIFKRSRTCVKKYEFWPSDLQRAGHTSVSVEEDDELWKVLQKIGKHDIYGIHMARMQKLPCKLIPTSKFRNGQERWWCPIHQGSYGKKKQVAEAKQTGVKCCDQRDALIDFVQSSDVLELTLVKPGEVQGENDYVELGLWIGLAPALDTFNEKTAEHGRKYFYAGIHVHARKEPGGKKVIDKNFPAVRIRDRTGRFSKIPTEGILVTSPAALEYLYYMEHRCPVNAQLGKCLDDQKVTRSSVDLAAVVRCKHCESLHEDIGDFFGENPHKKHLCGTCGRDIFGKANIGNPLQLFERPWRREIVGEKIDPQNKEIHIKTSEHRLMCWPSTPALFWSRDAPEIWGIHVHGFDAEGKRVIDDTYGTVYVDGKKLDRSKLFGDMLDNSFWMAEEAEMAAVAEELEDDLSQLPILDRCITERTLRLWPAVANGTFRQLQFGEDVKGAQGKQVSLPKGTLVTVSNWSRHRNPELWGPDAESFNPWREFTQQELARVGCPMAAANPQSGRFSPFAHNPRSCLGKNFAQMEMRLILSQLLRKFSFSLAPPYDKSDDVQTASTEKLAFRGVNRGGTMGPMDMERGGSVSPGERFLIALKMHVHPRA